MTETPRERLEALAAKVGSELRLAEGALLIAAEEYRDLSIQRYLAAVDHLADNAPSNISPEAAISLGMPGHFLVGCKTSGAPLFVDALAGAALTHAGYERLFSGIMGRFKPFRTDYLARTPARLGDGKHKSIIEAHLTQVRELLG